MEKNDNICPVVTFKTKKNEEKNISKWKVILTHPFACSRLQNGASNKGSRQGGALLPFGALLHRTGCGWCPFLQEIIRVASFLARNQLPCPEPELRSVAPKRSVLENANLYTPSSVAPFQPPANVRRSVGNEPFRGTTWMVFPYQVTPHPPECRNRSCGSAQKMIQQHHLGSKAAPFFATANLRWTVFCSLANSGHRKGPAPRRAGFRLAEGRKESRNSDRQTGIRKSKQTKKQGSLHYTPQHCLVNGAFPVFCWKKPCFEWTKCIF